MNSISKYLVASLIVWCATPSLYASSGPKADGVPTNNQRGRGSEPCRLWGGLDKVRHIVPTDLLVRVQLYVIFIGLKRPGARPIVLSSIAGLYWRRRRRLTILEPDEIEFSVFLILLRPNESLLLIHILDTILQQIWTAVQNMT